ncbi:cytochrome b5 reductase 4 family member [Anaeramoeba flamelloides]|uniref:Cytochrome b5 reductase 4 family member n=1 Tax=Anaeramoeba flamelloides TaxID=1746091 RepID=A0ABQ8Y086_9EUKA|nr:cytochrome b5 reductase 4 family member [Anaeramoeba flamelloides]
MQNMDKNWRPTQGKNQMGWMSLEIPPVQLKEYTLEEVKEHKKNNWMVLDNKVYDLTKYLEYHPGGIKIIEKFCGKDGTKAFNRNHRWVNFQYLLKKCQIGTVSIKSLQKKKESNFLMEN